MKKPPLITRFSANPNKKAQDKNLQAEIVATKPTKKPKAPSTVKPPKRYSRY